MNTTTPIGPGRKPRGEYAKTAAKREAILNAALEVFAESGYRAGSLREVAQRVDMSGAGLLHHFRSKEALLEAVLEHRDDLNIGRVPWGRASDDDILRGVVHVADYNASIPNVIELYCVISAEATSAEHPAHAYFVRRYAELRDNLGDVFARLAVAGRLQDGADPRRAAIDTIALMDGLQVQWLLDRDAVDMGDTLQRFFAGLVRDFHVERLAVPVAPVWVDAHL